MKIKYLTMLVLATSQIISCAFGQKVSYDGPYSLKIDPPASNTEIIVAVQDQRPYVLNRNNSEAYAGILRSLAGVPWPMRTSSGRPLAQDLGEGVSNALKTNGYSPDFILVQPTEDIVAVKDRALKSTPTNPLLYFLIKEWETDSWVSTSLSYCVELMTTLSGKQSRTSQCDKKTLDATDTGYSDLNTSVGTVFTGLLNAQETKNILHPVYTEKTALPQKVLKKDCSAEQLVELKKIGLSDQKINEKCN